jgi:hypothetical protein
MIITLSEVDCSDWYRQSEAERQQPTQMLLASVDKHTSGNLFPDPWYTVTAPLPTNNTGYSAVAGGSEMVRVPLFSYNVPGRQREVLFAAGVQAGMFAMHGLPPGTRVTRMHLAYGPVAELVDQETKEDMQQAWLGLAFQLTQ